MRRMLVSRISRRVLAEHHIALTEDYQSQQDGDSSRRDHVGIISTALQVKESIDLCSSHLRGRPYDVDHDAELGGNVKADWPDIVVDGHVDTKFAYIKEHLEYVDEVALSRGVFGLITSF